jgi:hypothetical protein
MTPLKRYLFLLLFIIIGIAFGISFGAIFYVIQKKKDDQITLKVSIMEVIIPSIFFWVTIGILIILKLEFGISIQLFVISGIILASFLSAISIKKAWIFFLGFGAVITELGIEHLIRRLIDYINCRANIMKEAKKKEDEIKGKIMLGNAPELKNLITNNAASNLSARSIASTP